MGIGRVTQLWRYPVKSMGGEQLEAAAITSAGLVGDRSWVVRDEVDGGIRGAKKLGALMRCAARYPAPPERPGELVGPAEITLPDGSRVMTDAPDAAARVSSAIGHPVTLWPLRPASDLDHYRRGRPAHPDVETNLRAVFAREPDEALPDLGPILAEHPELLEYESPPGSYFDAYPLLLLTEATLAALAGLNPAAAIDVRRFRPNVLIAVDGDGFVEAGWSRRIVRLGGVTAEVRVGCPRCVMITRGFADLPEDRSIMRTVVREAGGKAGVYADVSGAGTVAVGDPVELID